MQRAGVRRKAIGCGDLGRCPSPGGAIRGQAWQDARPIARPRSASLVGHKWRLLMIRSSCRHRQNPVPTHRTGRVALFHHDSDLLPPSPTASGSPPPSGAEFGRFDDVGRTRGRTEELYASPAPIRVPSGIGFARCSLRPLFFSLSLRGPLRLASMTPFVAGRRAARVSHALVLYPILRGMPHV
jgi:hypothetical protein